MARNYKLFKQVDFSNGMNVETPDALASETQLKRIVNMLPSDDGSALLLRPPFEDYPSTPTGAIPSDAEIIAIFPFKGWVSDVEEEQENLFRSDDMMVAYSYEGDTVIRRLITAKQESGDPYYPADSALLTYDMVWTETGMEPDEPIETTPPVLPYGQYRVRFNDLQYNSFPFPQTDTKTGVGIRMFKFMDDYWVNEDEKGEFGDGVTYLMGENNSYWSGEDYEYYYDEVDDGWADDGYSAQWAFDNWWTENTNTPPTTVRNNEISQGYVAMKFPFMLGEKSLLAYPSITEKIPRPQAFLFTHTFPEAQVSAFILFSKATVLAKAIRYVVQWKLPSSNTWNTVTKLDGEEVPVLCYTQGEGEYEEVAIGGVDYIKVPFIPGAKVVDMRIYALPGIEAPDYDDYEGAAEWIGVDV